MTTLQIEALEEMKRMSASPDLYLDMEIREGDIQFLNNRTILHGRTGYEDATDIARRRHMIRLWLEVPSWPALPRNQGVHWPGSGRCGCGRAGLLWSCRRATPRK